MHEGAKGDISSLLSRNITLVTKYMNKVNEVLKCIQVRSLSEQFVCCETKCIIGLSKRWCQNRSYHKQKGTILEVDNRKEYFNFEERIKKN